MNNGILHDRMTRDPTTDNATLRARIAELEQGAREVDEALMVAEGCSTVQQLAAAHMACQARLVELEAERDRLREALEKKGTADVYRDGFDVAAALVDSLNSRPIWAPNVTVNSAYDAGIQVVREVLHKARAALTPSPTEAPMATEPSERAVEALALALGLNCGPDGCFEEPCPLCDRDHAVIARALADARAEGRREGVEAARLKARRGSNVARGWIADDSKDDRSDALLYSALREGQEIEKAVLALLTPPEPQEDRDA